VANTVACTKVEFNNRLGVLKFWRKVFLENLWKEHKEKICSSSNLDSKTIDSVLSAISAKENFVREEVGTLRMEDVKVMYVIEDTIKMDVLLGNSIVVLTCPIRYVTGENSILDYLRT